MYLAQFSSFEDGIGDHLGLFFFCRHSQCVKTGAFNQSVREVLGAIRRARGKSLAVIFYQAL